MLYSERMSTPQQPESRRHVAVIFNPIKVDVDELKAEVELAEKEAGWNATLWLETSVDDPGQGMARQAVESGAAVVLAAGGDGTVRAVAEGLSNSGVPLVLLPAGTGNLLARNLGITLNRLPEAVSLAVHGEDRAIDMGTALLRRPDGSSEQHVFVVMVGIGLDAKMIAATNPALKKRVGWLAYVEAIARIARDVDAVRLSYSLDGSPTRSTTVHTLLIGNCGALPGNVLIMPEAKIDDGLLDIAAMRPRNLWGWIRVGTAVVWENGVLRKSRAGRRLLAADKRVRVLRYFQGRRADLRFEKPEEFEIDGESMGLVTTLSVRVEPASLIVRVPRDVSADRAGLVSEPASAS